MSCQTDSVGLTQFFTPNMLFYEDRLQTFENWPKQITPDKFSLAKAGFYYTGNSDKVRCFACGVGVMSWDLGDDAWKEHARWSGNCVFLKMTGHDTGITLPRLSTSRNAAPPGGYGAFGVNSNTGANLFVRRSGIDH